MATKQKQTKKDFTLLHVFIACAVFAFLIAALIFVR
jgi:hypothetical protein